MKSPTVIVALTLGGGLVAAVFLAAIANAGGWTPNLANTAWGGIVGGIVGALITGVVGVMLKGSLDEQLAARQAQLARDNAEALARIQGEVNREVQRALEVERGVITRDVERLKYELAREVEQSRLRSAKLHDVLPGLWERVLKPHRHLGRWYGFWQSPGWGGLNVLELQQNVRRAYPFVAEVTVDAFTAAFVQAEPRSRENVVKEHTAPLDLTKAQALANEAHLYLQQHELFLPVDVSAAAKATIVSIRQALSCAEYREDPESRQQGRDYDRQSDTNLEGLRVALRKALGVDPRGENRERLSADNSPAEPPAAS
jgi:hypothetical protein